MTLSTDMLQYASEHLTLSPEQLATVRNVAAAIETQRVVTVEPDDALLRVVTQYLVTTGRNVAVLYPTPRALWDGSIHGSRSYDAESLLAAMGSKGALGACVVELSRFRLADVYVVTDAVRTDKRLLDSTRPTAVWVQG